MAVLNCLPAVCSRNIRRKKQTSDRFRAQYKTVPRFPLQLQLISGGASLAAVSKGHSWEPHAVLLQANGHVAQHAISPPNAHTHSINPWHQELVIAQARSQLLSFHYQLSFKHSVTFRKCHSDHYMLHICSKIILYLKLWHHSKRLRLTLSLMGISNSCRPAAKLEGCNMPQGKLCSSTV